MKKITKPKINYAPLRIYTDEEIDQFIKDDQLSSAEAKRIDYKTKKKINQTKI